MSNRDQCSCINVGVHLSNLDYTDGEVLTLGLEALNYSTALGDKKISFTVKYKGAIVTENTVQITVISQGFFKVNPETLEAEKTNNIEISAPSPEVTVTEFYATNVRASGNSIIADIKVKGEVTSAIGNMLTDGQGIVDEVLLYNDNSDDPVGVLNVNEINAPAGNFLDDLRFTGAFNQTINDVKLNLGGNTFTVTAIDSIQYGAGSNPTFPT